MKMSNYVETYSVYEESGLTANSTFREACEGIAAWINEKFSDILTAEFESLNESYGYCRVSVRGKGDSLTGFWFGNASANTSDCRAGYICNGSMNYDNTTGSTHTLNFGFNKPSFPANVLFMKLVIIRGKYGFAADFIAPSVNLNKGILYAKLDEGFSAVMYIDKLYVEKNGVCYETGVTLPPQSNADKKVLSRFALPKTSILPEHLYLSDRFVGSNNPYTLNGKDYVDVLFDSGTYMGFALELS
jgi:hypothetical protein